MQYAENILETIGKTPLVKLNRITASLPCLVLAKYETFSKVGKFSFSGLALSWDLKDFVGSLERSQELENSHDY